MQEESANGRNQARVAATKAALMDAGKALFIQQGYADTGTPEIVRQAGVTRGALYHHFDGKAGLLRAIIVREMTAISEEIRAGAMTAPTAQAALHAGADAYFSAMQDAGRQRLILREGPAVLGPGEMAKIDAQAGAGGLADGLAAVMGARAPEPAVLDALSDMISAGFDRAVQRDDRQPYKAALELLLTALAR